MNNQEILETISSLKTTIERLEKLVIASTSTDTPVLMMPKKVSAKKAKQARHVTVRFTDHTFVYYGDFALKLFKAPEVSINCKQVWLHELFSGDEDVEIDEDNIHFILHDLREHCNPDAYEEVLKIADRGLASHLKTYCFLKGTYKYLLQCSPGIIEKMTKKQLPPEILKMAQIASDESMPQEIICLFRQAIRKWLDPELLNLIENY